jgi:hypothetical protein
MDQNVGLELFGCLVIVILLNLIVLVTTTRTRKRRRAFKALAQALFMDESFELSCMAEFTRVADRNQASFDDFCKVHHYTNHTDRQMRGIKRLSMVWERESIKLYVIQWHLTRLASTLAPEHANLTQAHMNGWDAAMSQYYMNRLTQARFILPELEINVLPPEKWHQRLSIRAKQFFLDQAISPSSSFSDPKVPQWEKHNFA